MRIVVVAGLISSILIAAWASLASAQTPSYYVLDHGALLPAYGDPSGLSVEQWQIWLYRSGEPQTGQNFWGMITGKTQEDVQRKLEQGQDFQVYYAKWSGSDYRQDRFTYFNAFGPVAKLKSDRSLGQKVGEVGTRIGKTFGALREGYQKARLILSDKVKQPNPHSAVGKTLKDYVDALGQGVSKVSELQKKLDLNQGYSDDMFDVLDEADKDLAARNATIDQAFGSGVAQPDLTPDADGFVADAAACITSRPGENGTVLVNTCSYKINLSYGEPGNAWKSVQTLQPGASVDTFDRAEIIYSACPTLSIAVVERTGQRPMPWSPLRQSYRCFVQNR